MFLVVEDSPVVAKQVEATLSDYGTVAIASCLAEAYRELEQRRQLLGMLVDVSLPDGNGLTMLETIRPQRPSLPVLVLTSAEDRETVQRAQLLGAQYLPKPAPRANLVAFAVRCMERWQSSSSRLEALVDELARGRGLSPREAEVILHVARGLAPADLAKAMSVSENTVKTLTRRALRKCDALRLADVVRPLQMSVWDMPPPSRP